MTLNNPDLDLQNLVSSQYERIVAAEPGPNGTAEIFIREADRVEKKVVPFKPFFLISQPTLLNGLDAEFEVKNLDGGAPMGHKITFQNQNIYQKALKFLKTSTGYSPSSPNAPYRVFSDPMLQFFVSEKFRLFRGMSFNEIRRLQLDIETVTSPGHEFPNAKREADQIIIVSLADNTGWEKVIDLDSSGNEKKLLEDMIKVIQERDPDVIEGHNLFRFDLPFIAERAKRHKVKLLLGRDNSAARQRSSRIAIAERTINYPRFDIYGRHIIDTFHLVQFYDVSHRDLESYGLKSVAGHFGISASDRTYVDGAEISSLWEKDREILKKYALDDVRETRALAAILSQSFFYQTQIIPLSYQNCVVRGNATRIDFMLSAEYLNIGASLPLPEAGRQFAGALTKAFKSGVFKNVWHCDIRSLYPSIILAEKWCPARDYIGVFPKLLNNLRTFRFKAKDAEHHAADQEEKDFYNSLQTTFKILINSFYGYLGFTQGTFNDYNMAEKVTTRGREILTSMLDFLNSTGAEVIEMDTDGIYFQPPENISSPDEMEHKIQNILPEGIEVELDETYIAMFCYKSKNYALLNENGEIAITGAALKSRGLEPYQREYIKKFISMLLSAKFAEIEKMTNEYRDSITNRKLPLAKLAKTETMNDSPDTYRKKLAAGKGRRSAVYELACNSKRDYRQGDQLSFYVTGEKKNVSVVDNSRLLIEAGEERDENTLYYLAKLEDLYKKFSVFIPQEEKNPGQDDLFGSL